MSAFAAAVGALFADPNIGRDAVYIADGGAPVLVRVVARRADAISDFGDARLAVRSCPSACRPRACLSCATANPASPK